MDTSSRLTTALALFLACRARGGDPRTLLAEHPALADLLEPLCADGGDGTESEPDCGDYRLGRELGRGAMGVVYEARHLGLDRRVALKLLAPEVAENPTQLARFQREARTLARLDHPHVVRVLDVGETEGRFWLAMEFVDGESLEQRLLRLQTTGGHSGTSRRVLVEAIASIGDALQHVHEAGILHRDVKPSNILLDRSERARLSDFGLARDTEAPAMTQVGIVAGTPHYMSPEHLAGGDALGPQSDVFSLGATLYECLLLRRAFAGDSTAAVLRAIVAYEPLAPRRVDPTVPRELAAIVLKALEKDPARRYASARAFADDLHAFLDLRPVSARPPSRWLRLRRWVKREPLQAALAGVLFLLAALAVVVLVQLPSVREAELGRREQEYEDALTAGDIARLGGDGEAALAAFARARALFPERTEAVVWQCFAQSEFVSPEAALRELETACGPQTSDEAVEGLRANLLNGLGRAEAAAAVAERIGPPTTPSGMMFAASGLLTRHQPGDLDRARQLMSLAVRMSRRPRLLLYACWAGIAPPEQQKECADAITTLWPNHPLAMQQAALCLAGSDPARAAALMRRAVDGGVKSKNAHQLLAALAWRAGDRATAVAAARDSLRLDRIEDDLRTRLIDNILRVAAPDAAAAEVAAWLEREPNNQAALRLRARELRGKGELDSALACLEQALASAPDDPDLGTERAGLLHELRRDPEAADLLAEVVAAHPAHGTAHEARVALLRALGDQEELVQELRRWAEARSTDPAAAYTLAQALALQQSAAAHGEALEAISRADYLTSGNDPRILDLRADIHAALGETVAAALCRERARAAAARSEQAK